MIIEKIRVPSPSRKIHLFEVTYKSSGFNVIGLMAEPINQTGLPGLLYLRGGIKTVGMVRSQRIIQWASEALSCLLLTTEEIVVVKDVKIFAGMIDLMPSMDLIYLSNILLLRVKREFMLSASLVVVLWRFGQGYIGRKRKQ